MGFDLGGAVNKAADWVGSAPIIRSVIGNPLYVALLLTALVAVVMLSQYSSQIKQAGGRRMARAGLFTFLLILAVMFIHNSVVTRSASSLARQEGIRGVFNSIQSRADMSTMSVSSAPTVGGASVTAPRGDNVADDTFVIDDVDMPSVLVR